MNKLRRLFFYALTAGAVLGTIAVGIFPPLSAVFVVGCLIGLQIWSITFMSVEPKLTRIALFFVLGGFVILFFALLLVGTT